MSLVETHEKRISRFKMFFHMIVIGAMVSFGLYCLSTWVVINNLDKKFIAYGCPKTVFISYLKNKYIWIPIPFLKNYQTPVEPMLQRVARCKTLPAQAYNRFIDKLLGRKQRSKKLLEESVQAVSTHLSRFKSLFLLFLSIYILLFSIFSMLGHKDKHIRGTQTMPALSFRLKLIFSSWLKRHHHIRIGKLPIPKSKEISHFLFMGSTRSGKSVTLNQFIHSIIERKEALHNNHKLIIYDLKGEFVGKWYSEKDILFFPFDQRSIKYSLFNEIKSDIDFKIIAKSLFEPPRNVSQNLSFFYEAGGEVFKTGLILLGKSGRKSNRHILEFFAQERDEIIKQFSTLPKALQGPIDYLIDSREAAGVLSTIHEKINFLEYLIDADGPFSFRDYIADEKDKRNLFIPNISNYKNIFMPLFSFGIDIMIKEVLSLPDNFNRRVFFLIDEFSSLHTIQSIFDFQRESGSKGGCLICAMQDLGDLSLNYGREKLHSFFNNFHTKFIFQLLDPDTQDYASRALGERQVMMRMPSHQYSPNDIGDRESISLQNTNERVVLPSEFSLLRKLRCFIQMSEIGISRIKIPRKFYALKQPHFLPRDFKIDLEVPGTGKVEEAIPPETMSYKLVSPSDPQSRTLFED